MNIHEDANVLICIFEYQIKGQCLRFDLVPTLLIYVEHRLRDMSNLLCVLSKFNLYYGKISYSPNEFFFFS